MQRCLGHDGAEAGADAGADEKAGAGAADHQTGEEAAPFGRGVFGHKGERAAVFAAHRYALQDAQGHQQGPGQPADRGLGRQKADGHRGGPHEDDGNQEHRPPP